MFIIYCFQISSTRDDISTNNFTISDNFRNGRVTSIKFRLQSENKGMFQTTLP